MSDINEIITQSMNRAFNAGKMSGQLLERHRILEIAKSVAHLEHNDHEWLALSDLEEYVNEQSN